MGTAAFAPSLVPSTVGLHIDPRHNCPAHLAWLLYGYCTMWGWLWGGVLCTVLPRVDTYYNILKSSLIHEIWRFIFPPPMSRNYKMFATSERFLLSIFC